MYTSTYPRPRRGQAYRGLATATGFDPAEGVALAACFLGVTVSLALKGGIVYLIALDDFIEQAQVGVSQRSQHSVLDRVVAIELGRIDDQVAGIEGLEPLARIVLVVEEREDLRLIAVGGGEDVVNVVRRCL